MRLLAWLAAVPVVWVASQMLGHGLWYTGYRAAGTLVIIASFGAGGYCLLQAITIAIGRSGRE